jgi:hypothetical protein
MIETILIWTVSILQILIALGLINVWLVRFSRATKYRGGQARNMKEEFATYGLPSWFMYVVGFIKMVIAFTMIFLLFVPKLMAPFGVPALILLSVLMLGAITMHIKVKDSLVKTLPAIAMLTMSLLIICLVYTI